MRLTLEEIRRKEVVNIIDGSCFGFADDIVIDTETKQVIALVMKGESKFFGLLHEENEISVPWENIDTIGRDTILVKTDQKRTPKQPKANIFCKILNNLIELVAK